MKALDTNVLVRLFTADDATQTARAAAELRSGEAWVSRTVLLETEWVLRYTYQFDPAAISRAFSALLGLEGLEVESRAVVLRALAWHRDGVDFADALHLAAVPDEVAQMVTFDRSFARRARRAGATPRVREPGAGG